MKTKSVKFILTFVVILFAMVAFAQPGGSGGGFPGGGNPPSGESAPIDGGVVMLLAGVAGYAHHKLKLKRESEKKSE